MPEEDEDEPTFVVVTGGLSDEPQHATVDGVEVIRRPGESLDDFKAYCLGRAKKKDRIVIGGLPD